MDCEWIQNYESTGFQFYMCLRNYLHITHYYRRIVSPPPNSYVKTLTPNVTAFEDRAFKGIIKVKWGHKDMALIG